jgi:hypothetical protein
MSSPEVSVAPPTSRDRDELVGALRFGGRWVVANSRALATAPRYRRLRWILLAGIAIRLVLAPLTSWGIDTPYFTLSAARMLQTGSPYGGDTFFNGPFGPVAELPGFALASLFGSPSSFVVSTPNLLPVAIHSQIVIPYLPTPAALLVLKLPMIASDVLVALLVYHGVRLYGGVALGTAAAAAWFLNPLVFWVSAVHGEVDTFAALFVLAAILALERRLAFVTGVLLGLGTFAKIYPVLLVPLAVVVLATDAARGSGLRPRLAPIGRLLAGLALSVVPFLPLLAGLSVVLAHQAGNLNFGGLSLLIVFNPNITSIARLWPPGTSSAVVVVLEATLVLGVVLAVGAVLLRFRRAPSSTVPELPWLALLALAGVSGSLLAILTTQAENIVAVLPLLLLAAPLLGRWSRRLYWTISLSAFAEYLALLTPVAFFYPLFEIAGPGAVRWANGVVLPYALDQTAVPAGAYWIVLGVVGGGTLLGIWGLSVVKTWKALRPSVVRVPGGAPDSRTATIPAVDRRPWSATGSHRRPAVVASVAAVLVVVLLAVEVGTAVAAVGPPRSTLQVAVLSLASGATTTTATLRLTAGSTPLTVHVGILPGRERAVGPVHVFNDAAYPDPNGSFTTTAEVLERTVLALAGTAHPPSVATVDGAALPALLAAGPPGTLVVLGGLVPDSVLSNSSQLLATWVADGGTLIWAGGPLGASEGHPVPGGFVSDPLGWAGQLDLVHYPLSDVGAPGPLRSGNATGLANALGTAYDGTPTGANTTAVASHGGVDLGLDGRAGSAGASLRSSLVYQPVGAGGVFYFGGSVWGAKQPPLDVPTASFELADDLALLLGTGYVPAPGPSASANLALDAGESVTLRLTVPVGLAPNGLVALVTTPTLPTFLSIWSTTLAAPSG